MKILFNTNHSIRHRGGFALIATISVMVLLVLIALAMLSLSTIELRQSGLNRYQQEAQANARMALMMAIGQLQNYAGPDQRVTASAEMFAQGTSTIKHPLWVGVWRSDQMPNNSNTPIFTRDNTTGSWKDARTTGGAFDLNNALGWLVSGNNPNPNGTTSPAEGMTVLQKKFTSLAGEVVADVEVPLINVQGDGGASGKIAWFTDDLSQKANVELDNRFRPDSLVAPNHVAEYYAPYGFGNYKEPVIDAIRDADAKKIFSLASIGVPGHNNKVGLAAQRDYTAYSQSLLTDTQRGGLKKDLTAFCESSSDLPNWSHRGKTYIAYKGSDSIIRDETNPLQDSSWHHKYGAKWGLIRNWYQLKNKITETGSGATMKSEIAAQAPRNKKITLDPRMVEDTPTQRWLHSRVAVPDLEKYDQIAVHPVIVMAENQLVPCLEGAGDPVKDQTRRLFIKFYPRVVLWNPYNVTIKTQGYYVQSNYMWRVKIGFHRNGISDNPAGGTVAAYNNGSYNIGTMDLSFDQKSGSPSRNFANPICQPIYYLEPTEIGPGESLMFTPKADMEWKETTKPSQMVLSATGGQNAFIIKEDKFVVWPGSSSRNLVKILQTPTYYRLDFSRYRSNKGWTAGSLGKQRTWYLFKAKSGSSDWASVHNDSSLLLQSLYLSEDGYMASDAPIDRLPSTLLKSETSHDMPDQGRVTHRWHYFTENPVNAQDVSSYSDSPFKSSPMANFNVRANWTIPTPLNVFSRSRTGRHVFEHYMSSLVDDPMTSSKMAPFLGQSGKNCYSPFGYANTWGGVDQYVLFDLPKPSLGVLSLGMLQHLNFSLFDAAPTYAVGNSYADIRYAQDKTSPAAISQNASTWTWYLHKSSGTCNFPANIYFAIQSTTPPKKNLFNFDLAFEMNQALWDSYFFSNGKYATSSWTPDLGDWLSPYYQVTSLTKAAQDCFKDKKEAYHHVAEYLSVPGGFNVNSVSVPAWKAFLASCAQKDKSYKNGSGKGSVFFSRTHPAIGNAYDSANDTMFSQSAWNGYRSLNDDELELLAKEIVKQVKLRGPFISVADFVNRRLVADSDLGKSGALQAAIDASGLNTTFKDTSDNYQSFYERAVAGRVAYNNGISLHPGHSRVPFENLKAMPETRVRHCPAFLQQGDILQALGPRIRVRGDTFRIRSYGDSRDARGNIMARAWVEAIVQRIPNPLSSKWDGIGPEPTPSTNPDVARQWGREFKIVSFRWLNKEEL